MEIYNFEKKYNFYKNSNLSNKNYKMNKYLDKLNISGGTGFKKVPPSFKKTIENLLGRGAYAPVHQFIDDDLQEYAIKIFDSKKEYLIEKELFIQKLSIFCGNFDIATKTYYGITAGKVIDITDNNITDNGAQMIITGDILTYINSIEQIRTQPITDLIITLDTNPEIIELNIFNRSIDGLLNSIGTLIKNRGKYYIYIDIPKSMKLLYYDDSSLTLFYKNFGISLKNMLKTSIPFIQKIYLCIDLIRQINDLINAGIHHNDLKNDNIVVKQIGDNFYLTIIDYGLAKTNTEIKKDHISRENTFRPVGDHYYNTTANAFSPEYLLINILIHNRYRITGKTITYTKVIELFNKSLHWIIGGICVNILNSNNIQLDIWKLYLGDNLRMSYDIAWNYEKLKRYTNDICMRIPNITTTDLITQDEKDLYSNLDICIRNLLQIHPEDKELLSVHFERLNIEPYVLYRTNRQASGIDF